MSKSGDEIEYTKVVKVKMPVSALEVGMFVCELDRPWLETPFLFQGFELKSREDIAEVCNICEYVYVDVLKENRLTREPATRKSFFQFPSTKDTGSAKRGKRRTFEKEFSAADRTFRQTSRLVKTMMDEIRLGNSLDMQAAKDAVSECVHSILRNPDALMWLTQLKNKDEYTSQHSLNVSLYSIALGRHLGLPVKELEKVGLCGMMHDMGKLRTPNEVLNKPGKLTREELAIMQQHPAHGRDILISSRGVEPGVIDVAYAHHERLDGAGYPRGLDAKHLPLYVKLVSIVDTYDAITSARVYQYDRTHLEGIKILMNSRFKQFDSSLVVKFVECLGIYPPGSVVEMRNGEVGIVLEVNPEQKIRPKVLLLVDEVKKPRTRVVDLSKLDLDASGCPYRIKAMLRHNAYGINIQKFYERGLIGGHC